MTEYKIIGGTTLTGEIKISGAKNAALKLMAASLLTAKEIVLENVPLIEDVYIMAEALKSLGVKVEVGNNRITIEAKELTSHTAPYELVSKMRASILVMGPLLSRLGLSTAAMPGGCRIGLRKIDFHIKGLEALGAQISLDHGFIEAKASKLRGCEIHLDFPSVGATENLLMAAVLAEGTTVIRNAAREPEISDLASFLNLIGARIRGAGTSTLTVEGVRKLEGGRYKVIADRIEAGTFLVLGAICGKKLVIDRFNPADLQIVLDKLNEVGANLKIYKNSVTLNGAKKIKPCNLATLPYPGFPTDLQGLFMTLLSGASGQSIITENIFENRFLLANELTKLGADIIIQGHRALIKGVAGLKGESVDAPDLRGGAALVVAGLVAEGTTIVKNIHHIDRGYEAFDEKLCSLGARLERVKEESINKVSGLNTEVNISR